MASFYRRQIFQEALQIIWRRKYLWFVGFFAGLVAYGGEADFFFRNASGITTLQNYLVAIRETVQAGDADFFMSKLRQFVAANTVESLSYIALVVLVTAVFTWIIIISQATIVRIVGRITQKKPTGLFDGLATGSTKFWSIFIMNVIIKLLTAALWVLFVIIPAAAYFLNGNDAWAVMTSVSWFLITIPIGIIVSFLMKYALSYITLRDESAIQSLRSGWKLFQQNWLMSLELAFLIYIINVGVSVVVAGVALLFIQPFTPFGLISLLFVLALVLGFVSAFSYTSWTIVFYKLQEGRAESKLEKWTTGLVNFAGSKKITK